MHVASRAEPALLYHRDEKISNCPTNQGSSLSFFNTHGPKTHSFLAYLATGVPVVCILVEVFYCLPTGNCGFFIWRERNEKLRCYSTTFCYPSL